MKEFTQSAIQFAKQQGLSAVLIIILLFFMNNFNAQLEEIKKDLVNIKMTLVEIQSKYIEKQQVRKIVDEKIKQHEERYHKN